MLDFLLSQISLYSTFLLLIFLPGALLLLATKLYKHFSLYEILVLSFGLSIVLVDFIVILNGKMPFGITKASTLSFLALFFLGSIALHYRNQKKASKSFFQLNIRNDKFKKNYSILLIALIFLTIFIKTVYLKDAIFPTATDLGHHMYWAKKITLTGELPVYEEAEIGKDYLITQPEPIADFIIGEHLIFAAVSLVSGADFVSSFPVLLLFLIHIVTLLSIFVLTKSLFTVKEDGGHDFAHLVAIIALFLIGPLFAVASPQAKFVSGGVIGNDIGNLLIPLTILLFINALRKNNSSILTLAIFMGLGLAYTHHLSTFIFIFISLFTIITYSVFNFKTTLFKDLKHWIKMIFTPQVISILIFSIVFILFFYTPTYLNVKAVDTAVGTPSKATRTGLTFDQLKATAGEARFAFALIGLVFLIATRSLEKYGKSFLIGWILSLTAMSLAPGILFIDIPSNRVASYIVFPVAIVSSFMLVALFKLIYSMESTNKYLNPKLLLVTFFLVISFITSNGTYENALSLNTGSNSSPALQTYAASRYVASKTNSQDVVLKDHNYLSGDAWIKLYFMQDYNFPFSRGFFKRYQDETKPREQCTNLMISTPNSAEAKKCFTGTGTDFIMVDPKMDSAQFRRQNDFWQIYSADDIMVFYKSK